MIFEITIQRLKTSYNVWNICINTYFFDFTGGIAGFLGSFIDSIMGATLQYSGVNKKSGAIVEKPSKDANSVEHISGSDILDNHEVNLLSSLVTAIIVPTVTSILFWYYIYSTTDIQNTCIIT